MAAGSRHIESAWLDADELVRLVRDAQRAGPGAVDALLARLRPCFLAFFTPAVGGDNAEDLAQAALIRTARSLATIQPAHARAYLVTLARNVLRSERRRRARETRLLAALAEALETPSIADPAVESSDLVDALYRASLATLSPTLRESLLGTLAGLSPSALAARDGVRAAVIRTRLWRARAHLRGALGDDA